METNSPAEELPALYRAILDRVADLERTGERPEAARIRTAATAAYSRAWDDKARRRLRDLLRRADRTPTAGREMPGPERSYRRPTAPIVASDN
jgi:hypothetical protein